MAKAKTARDQGRKKAGDEPNHDKQLVGIVLLDLRGYSGLKPDGQDAVFNEFLRSVRDLLDEVAPATGEQLLDANTWGDSILAVFKSTVSAVKFAQGVRRLIRQEAWKERSLKDLGVRIAVHVAELKKGTDQIRDRSRAGSHVYGTGIVIPARLEPQVPPNAILVTAEAATPIQAALRQELRGQLVDFGEVDLAKSAGKLRVWWLGDEGEAPPSKESAKRGLLERLVPPVRATVSQLQIVALRLINECVEDFHVCAQHCGDPSDLDRLFEQSLDRLLLHLRLRAVDMHEQFINADIMRPNAEGYFEIVCSATDLAHHRSVPQMQVRDGAQVYPGDGVAAYCFAKNAARVPGVAIAHDVRESSDVIFYQRTTWQDPEGPGNYRPERVQGMYKPPPHNEKPPYRSILSAAIPEAVFGADCRKAEIRYIGILNVTSPHENVFDAQDCAWAEAAASLVGSFLQSYEARKHALDALKQG